MAKQARQKRRLSQAARTQDKRAVAAAVAPAIQEPGDRNWLDALDARLIGGVILIIAAILWIYSPTLHGSWLWDDDYLLENNEVVHDPFGLWNIWLQPTTLIDYFPLTVTLEWLEWQIWPDNVFCFHITNVILHIGSSILVWHLLHKLGVRLAWLGGFIFAIHPVLVESVAWMAEIKNTLSLPPFLLAMCFWIDFEKTRRDRHYLLALFFFLVAMLCKTSMVMFPVTILLYAWYLRGRIDWSDIKRTIPFFVISVMLSLVVIALLRKGVGEETIPLGGIGSRFACAGLSIAFYFSKVFLPVTLTPLYPQWIINPPQLWQFIPWVVMAGAGYYAWTERATWGKYAILGAGFFLINVAPFVGFRAIAFMRFGWTMDHILYVPIIGLIGLFVAGLGDFVRKLEPTWRPIVWILVTVIMGIFTFSSRDYSKTYVDSVALWSSALERFPNGWVAHNNLGNALSDRGLLFEAELQYIQALQINPGYPEAHNNLGIIYCKNGQIDEAISEFQETLRLCPDLQSAQVNLEMILEQKKAREQGSPPPP